MITKQDLTWIFEATLLNLEGEESTRLIGKVPPRHITIGRKVLDFIKEEW